MSKLTVTAKVQVKTTPADEELLIRTMDVYRQACNYVAAHIDKAHILGLKVLNEALYYTLRDKFGLKAQMAQSILKTVVARYKTILKKQKEWIRPEFKVPQLDLVWNRGYSLSKDVFSANTLAGRVKMGYFPYGMESYFDKDVHFNSS